MENRHDIKKRMIASAAKMWGITSKEMKTVDPLISLLIDACASEIENISISINEVRQNMQMKLMELLTPHNLISPVPARAIMHAHPFEYCSRVMEDHEFYFKKTSQIDKEEPVMEIFLSPIREHTLYDADVQFIASGNTLFRIDSSSRKTKVCSTKSREGLVDVLWIGMRLNKSVTSLKGMSFYFDIENVNDLEEKLFFNALKTGIWEINNIKLNVHSGYCDTEINNNKKQIKLPTSEFNTSFALSHHVLDFYKKYFISFSDDQTDSLITQDSYIVYPDSFTQIFDQVDLEVIDSKLVWIKVSFPQYIAQQLLDHVVCTVNCFPVINRKTEKIVITGYERIKELWAEPHEVFFDLKNIICDEELEIILGDSEPKNMEGKALLTLRKDNIGRMDRNNAVDMITRTINAYKSEYAAFSKIKSIEPGDVEKLYDAIRPFEHGIDEIRNYTTGTNPYIMLKTDPAKEDVEVELSYYLTNGSLGNQIPAYEPINFDGADLIKNKLFLMTQSMGGTDVKQDEDLMREFRYSVLSHGRLVTIEDIKALCESQYGKYADAIEVKKDVETNTQNQSGLTRIISISINLKKNIGLKPEEIKLLRDDLQLQLEENSLNVLPFKVILFNKN
jgi:cupin superfamily acireductone dioxygenase involved in methionine salvage|tara:strand:- start:13 stop:1869 length:1857 start_codon:yes stop_codon:yes gene_type:complete